LKAIKENKKEKGNSVYKRASRKLALLKKYLSEIYNTCIISTFLICFAPLSEVL